MTSNADQDLERWRALVERGLKGAPFDSLVGKTLEGIAIQPLYTERDRPSEEGVPWAPRSPRLVGPAGVLPESLSAHRDAGASLAWVFAGAGELPETEDLVTVAVSLRGVEGLASKGSRWVRPVADPWTGWVTLAARRKEADQARALDEIATAVSARRPSLGVASWVWDVLYGANAIDELALSLASLVESLRALDARGVSLDDAVDGATVGVGIGVEFFDEIAKLRALRRLVNRVLVACAIQTRPLIVAVNSSHNHQPVDRPVNLLRNTIAASAALLGGADGVAVYAHERIENNALPERIARNVPLVLALESFLPGVDDPARGSFYVERLTDELVRAAWESFREIEREGGLARAHARVVERLERSQAQRRNLIRTRRRPLVGVSRFPTREPGRDYDASDAKPFIEVRARAQGQVARVITLAACPSARVDFAREILAISGLSDDVVALTDDAAAALSNASIVILAAPDAALPDELPTVVRALRAAGAKAIGVAAKPGAHEQALRDAGVDAFVFLGADVVTFAETLLEKAS
ncbi:methylmalonyl-CoA mutase family protein [Sandaracinus amylolyticus]|uniref:methylmalonyl-CoA mutase family protein n=1 Tax=Sandaracinus amylolyticus TaxID=927083 RepID=UPI001F4431E5|nr:methylmalonyl-CoA mutase family protein [Sandaracinus amylolyticus]UJR80581.1 Methylmalonyl-CoA mutase [Sandaracinus amylolyticus]